MPKTFIENQNRFEVGEVSDIFRNKQENLQHNQREDKNINNNQENFQPNLD